MIGRPLIRLDSVTSTQDVAFRLADLGAPEGTTVLARHQTGGRGRAGRSWETVPGDALLFSLVLRPSRTGDRLTPLSILVADGVANALVSLYDLSPSIKWPNDVLLGGRKVSGVLIQVRGGVAVVGVGINLIAGRESLPEGATSIRTENSSDPDPDVLLQEALSRIGRRYHSLLDDDIARDIVGLNERLWLRGQVVSVQVADRMVNGIIHGVRADGALLLDTQDGARAIVSGELTRGPRSTLP